MALHWSKMVGSNGRETRINSFALVSYLSGPIAELLDQIRHDFAPESRAKAHLTILPPRPLLGSHPLSEQAIAGVMDELKDHLQDFEPFPVELGEIEVFEGSQVIYVSIQSGFKELERMHQRPQHGPHGFRGTVSLSPARDRGPGASSQGCSRRRSIRALALERIQTPRSMQVERLTFVQNTIENCWTDLAMLDLGSRVTL